MLSLLLSAFKGSSSGDTQKAKCFVKFPLAWLVVVTVLRSMIGCVRIASLNCNNDI